jgi:hypothetical protein
MNLGLDGVIGAHQNHRVVSQQSQERHQDEPAFGRYDGVCANSHFRICRYPVSGARRQCGAEYGGDSLHRRSYAYFELNVAAVLHRAKMSTPLNARSGIISTDFQLRHRWDDFARPVSASRAEAKMSGLSACVTYTVG